MATGTEITTAMATATRTSSTCWTTAVRMSSPCRSIQSQSMASAPLRPDRLGLAAEPGGALADPDEPDQAALAVDDGAVGGPGLQQRAQGVAEGGHAVDDRLQVARAGPD